ncbi:hypothetical protein H8356DRAFT_1423293 [Neocallimastix lanati (nom. inval.)]|nr:hypothetical protein H8356DRAFT_1423293 [Neocallimastix sp. JGI-2020a]
MSLMNKTPFLILNDCGNCPLTFTQTLEDKYKFSINLKHLPQIFNLKQYKTSNSLSIVFQYSIFSFFVQEAIPFPSTLIGPGKTVHIIGFNRRRFFVRAVRLLTTLFLCHIVTLDNESVLAKPLKNVLEAIASNFSHSSMINTTSIIASNNFSISVIVLSPGGENPCCLNHFDYSTEYHFIINLIKDRQIKGITFVRNSAIPTKYGIINFNWKNSFRPQKTHNRKIIKQLIRRTFNIINPIIIL